MPSLYPFLMFFFKSCRYEFNVFEVLYTLFSAEKSENEQVVLFFNEE